MLQNYGCGDFFQDLSVNLSMTHLSITFIISKKHFHLLHINSKQTNWIKKDYFQLRTSRNTLEECGVVAFQIKKREQNFTRMLTYIFARWLVLITFSWIKLLFQLFLMHFSRSGGSPERSTWNFSLNFHSWLDQHLPVCVPTNTNPLLYVVWSTEGIQVANLSKWG